MRRLWVNVLTFRVERGWTRITIMIFMAELRYLSRDVFFGLTYSFNPGTVSIVGEWLRGFGGWLVPVFFLMLIPR
jgi:hypothetical protein